MNTPPDPRDLSPGEDRLMDSLLSEHARLGKDADHDLVASILRQTIHAPIVTLVPFSPSPSPVRRSSFGLSDWVKAAAIFVAIAALGALLLTGIRTRESSPTAALPQRQEQVFQIVVQESESPKQQTGMVRQFTTKVYLSTQAGEVISAPFDINSSALDSLGGLDLADLEFPAGQSQILEPSVITHPLPKPFFSLASNQSSRSGNKVTYSGDVVLKHRNFILEADSIVMEKSGARFEAANASLTHRAGAYQTEARVVTFSPVRGELVARGIKKLVERGKEQKIDPSAAAVVFEADQLFIKKEMAAPSVQE